MGKLIFITGSVRSGKSAFAESYALKMYQEQQKKQFIYIASGVPIDEEMKQRIKRHQMDRMNVPMKWKTIEIPDDISHHELLFTNQHVVLWDCITTWLSNILYQTETLESFRRFRSIDEYIKQLKQQILQWKQDGVTILIVSNEVMDEPQSIFSEVEVYRNKLGQLHQWIVLNCDEAYELDYGLVQRRK